MFFRNQNTTLKFIHAQSREARYKNFPPFFRRLNRPTFVARVIALWRQPAMLPTTPPDLASLSWALARRKRHRCMQARSHRSGEGYFCAFRQYKTTTWMTQTRREEKKNSIKTQEYWFGWRERIRFGRVTTKYETKKYKNNFVFFEFQSILH